MDWLVLGCIIFGWPCLIYCRLGIFSRFHNSLPTPVRVFTFPQGGLIRAGIILLGLLIPVAVQLLVDAVYSPKDAMIRLMKLRFLFDEEGHGYMWECLVTAIPFLLMSLIAKPDLIWVSKANTFLYPFKFAQVAAVLAISAISFFMNWLYWSATYTGKLTSTSGLAFVSNFFLCLAALPVAYWIGHFLGKEHLKEAD